jgi:hypothetical protein
VVVGFSGSATAAAAGSGGDGIDESRRAALGRSRGRPEAVDDTAVPGLRGRRRSRSPFAVAAAGTAVSEVGAQLDVAGCLATAMAILLAMDRGSADPERAATRESDWQKI